ncbi:MAG TPA: hypothetical protein VMS98_03055 [Thermoanaerobaculia bacterium]|nr:hypothetical protein [Thermoanaerobaculia bacterium]
MSKTVRYTKAAGVDDDQIVANVAEAVEDVGCSQHRDQCRLDAFGNGQATISACCRPALDRADKAFRAATTV